MSFPYANAVPGFLNVLKQLRSTFPKTVTSDTLKKWGFAPNNENYVISTLKYIKIINDDGTKNDDAARIFSLHEDSEFQKAFKAIIKQAYSELFELHSENAWTLEKGKLISFFRQADGTSDTIGKRQASTFIAIASVCGYGEPLPIKNSSGSKKESTSLGKKGSDPISPEKKIDPKTMRIESMPKTSEYDANLTVRIEINLPVTDDQDVYNKIFKSIKENLLK